MTIVDVVVHVVVVAELLESFDELSAAEETEVEELDLLVWNHLVRFFKGEPIGIVATRTS